MTERANFPIIASSANSLGLTADKSSFYINFDEPFEVRDNSYIEIVKSAVWWNIFNISSALNNNKFQLLLNPATPIDITIPDGLYSLSQLSTTINNLLTNEGVGTEITLLEDSSQQKAYFQFTNACGPTAGRHQIEFTDGVVPNNCRQILGFNSRLVPLVDEPAGHSAYADTTADFGSITGFNIHCDLVNKGIPLNGQFSQIISQSPIVVSPGSLNTYLPYSLVRIPVGTKKKVKTIRFYITDQLNSKISLNDDWSVEFNLTI
jgi:hypothetical protein